MTEGCRPSWPGRDDGRLARLGGVIDGPGVGIVSGIFGYAFATAWRTDAHGAVARASTPTYFGSWRRVPAASPDTRFENPRTPSVQHSRSGESMPWHSPGGNPWP